MSKQSQYIFTYELSKKGKKFYVEDLTHLARKVPAYDAQRSAKRAELDERVKTLTEVEDLVYNLINKSVTRSKMDVSLEDLLAVSQGSSRPLSAKIREMIHDDLHQ